jgi:hypothetical protein
MTHSRLPRYLCRMYGVLLYAYPRDFRRRYGREMAQVFGDRCRRVAETQGLRGLVRFGAGAAADWLITTIREGMDSMQEDAHVPAFDGVPGFYTIGSGGPRPGALVNGGVVSLAIFLALSVAIGRGVAQRRLLIGSHHPSRSHLLGAQTSAAPAGLATEVKAAPYPDEPPVNPYFRLILVLGVLDTDRDNVISAAEIAHAPAALRKLDLNHDGKLTAEECGYRPPAGLTADFRLRFMRFHPALDALDADHDGEISAREIENAPARLWSLDANGDGRLTLDELLPHPR